MTKPELKPSLASSEKPKYHVTKVRDMPVGMKDLLLTDGCCYLRKAIVEEKLEVEKGLLPDDDDIVGRFVLNRSEGVAMVAWKNNESKLSKYLDEISTDDKISNEADLGQIRNQKYHLLCSAYVASDLVSSLRRLYRWEKKFIPLCTWYLCSYCHPERLGKDPRRKVDTEGRDHHCYGSTIEDYLLHIQEKGIPREYVEDFDCSDYEPISAEQPDMETRRIDGARRINTLEEALLELKNQPIGADLVNYAQLFEEEDIYYGPKSEGYSFMGYHTVIIKSVLKLGGEWVAQCKMSNGVRAANSGYCYVSLATQYMAVGVSEDKKFHVRGLAKPSYLLTNFIVPEISKHGPVEEEVNEKEEEKNRIMETYGDGEELYVPIKDRPPVSKRSRR